ncbi:MAG: hypothetical protein ACRCYU_00795 [Nocardioides sp.]
MVQDFRQAGRAGGFAAPRQLLWLAGPQPGLTDEQASQLAIVGRTRIVATDDADLTELVWAGVTGAMWSRAWPSSCLMVGG